MTRVAGVQRFPTQPNGEDEIVAEVAVALVYNGVSHVVMMATPADLEDFALGFSLSERILDDPAQLYGLEVVPHPSGVEIRMEIASAPFAALKSRRRNLAGRTGCGLCGAESLEQALPAPRRVTQTFSCNPSALHRAAASLDGWQPLRQRTGSAHAAAFCALDGTILAAREDVGRHNALDKLIGALTVTNADTEGFVVVTSRASYEMVAKTAAAGIPLLAAVSAPTSLAIEQAVASNLTLIGHLSADRHVVYAGAQRLESGA